jgi:hypothetical protein
MLVSVRVKWEIKPWLWEQNIIKNIVEKIEQKKTNLAKKGLADIIK